jgi:ATP-dependent RNA helicase DeaD
VPPWPHHPQRDRRDPHRPGETYFQVPKAMEERFRAALQRTAREGAEDETGIRIEPSEPPREMARTNRRQGNGPNRPREGFRVAMGPRSDGPRPHRKGPPRRRED